MRKPIRAAASAAGLFLAAALASAPASAGRSQLIMFETPKCGFCKVWLRDVGSGYGSTEYGRMLPLRRVDISRGMPSDLRGVEAPRGVPTFVIWTCSREMARFSGYSSKQRFYQTLKSHVEMVRRKGC